MRSASECRAQARACRALARSMGERRRQQTLDMAETWEGLAREVDSANSRYISDMLKATYGKVAQEPVPEVFNRLLKQLESAEPNKR